MISGQYISALRAADAITSGGEDVYVGDELVVLSIDATPLPADRILVEDVNFTLNRYLVRVMVYLDGGGGHDAGQCVKPVLYGANGLVATGPAVLVPPGAPAAWVSLVFDSVSEIPPGDYRFGIQSGPLDQAARYYVADATGSYATIISPYADGPPESIGAGAVTGVPVLMFLETLDGARIPTNVDDDYLAALPFDVTQRTFGSASTIRTSRLSAIAGWYGTSFDPTDGANALVRSGGQLADRVGERLRVALPGVGIDRSVCVYVHDERDFPDELTTEDLLLSSRAFLALGNLALDTLNVVVETLQ